MVNLPIMGPLKPCNATPCIVALFRLKITKEPRQADNPGNKDRLILENSGPSKAQQLISTLCNHIRKFLFPPYGDYYYADALFAL